MTLTETRVDTQLLADLRNLRRTFEVFGWCQGRAEDDAGRLCLLAGICYAIGGWAEGRATFIKVPERFEVVRRSLNAVRPDPDVLIGSGWNDHIARSVDDVYALIDAAITVEEQA